MTVEVGAVTAAIVPGHRSPGAVGVDEEHPFRGPGVPPILRPL